jgi:hypothetical protein
MADRKTMASRRGRLEERALERKADRKRRREGIREGIRMWKEDLIRELKRRAEERRANDDGTREFRLQGGARIMFRSGQPKRDADGMEIRAATAVDWIQPDGEVRSIPLPSQDDKEVQ